MYGCSSSDFSTAVYQEHLHQLKYTQVPALGILATLAGALPAIAEPTHLKHTCRDWEGYGYNMAMERKPAGRMQGGGAGLSNLAELVERILDKGIVIDAWVSVSLIGIEVLSVQARVVVASVDTYLKYAEALAQTVLTAQPQAAQAGRSRVPQDAQVGQSRVQALPSDEQVTGYLSSHPDGAQMTDLEQHFGVPRHELDPIVSRLTEQHRLHRDEEKNRYLSDL